MSTQWNRAKKKTISSQFYRESPMSAGSTLVSNLLNYNSTETLKGVLYLKSSLCSSNWYNKDVQKIQKETSTMLGPKTVQQKRVYYNLWRIHSHLKKVTARAWLKNLHSSQKWTIWPLLKQTIPLLNPLICQTCTLLCLFENCLNWGYNHWREILSKFQLPTCNGMGAF